MEFNLEEKETLISVYANNPALWITSIEIIEIVIYEKPFMKSYWLNLCKGNLMKMTLERNDITSKHNIKGRKNGTNHRKLPVQVGLHTNMDVFWRDELCGLNSGCRRVSDNFRCCEATKLKVAEDVKVEAEKAKIELWIALASSLKSSPQVAPSNDDSVAYPAHAPTLVERANLIGKLGTDNSLECDPKDWSILRKRIFDMFFEYQQRKSLSMQASALKPQTSHVFGFQNNTNIYSQHSYSQQLNFQNLLNSPLLHYGYSSHSSTTSENWLK